MHMSKTFLNVDEAATLRDTLDNLRQSAYETDASCTRRFRDIAQDCYPAEDRNVDQDRIIIIDSLFCNRPSFYSCCC